MPRKAPSGYREASQRGTLPGGSREDPPGYCASCGQERPARLLLRPLHLDVDDLRCHDCYDEIMRAWLLQSERSAALDGYYRRTYGISIEDYGRRFVEQGGRCAICDEPQSDKLLVVDHDHQSGVVRGLLCGRCNTGIGQLRDSPMILARAIAYLT